MLEGNLGILRSHQAFQQQGDMEESISNLKITLVDHLVGKFSERTSVGQIDHSGQKL